MKHFFLGAALLLWGASSQAFDCLVMQKDAEGIPRLKYKAYAGRAATGYETATFDRYLPYDKVETINFHSLNSCKVWAGTTYQCFENSWSVHHSLDITRKGDEYFLTVKKAIDGKTEYYVNDALCNLTRGDLR